MNYLQIISSVFSIVAFPSLIALIWKDLYTKKKAKGEHTKSLYEEERRKDMKEAIREELEPLHEDINNISNKLDQVSEGTVCVLRNAILQGYYSCAQKGYYNDNDYSNIHHLYETYTALGGNSFVADVMERFDSLPAKEEFIKEKEN